MTGPSKTAMATRTPALLHQRHHDPKTQQLKKVRATPSHHLSKMGVKTVHNAQKRLVWVPPTPFPHRTQLRERGVIHLPSMHTRSETLSTRVISFDVECNVSAQTKEEM